MSQAIVAKQYGRRYASYGALLDSIKQANQVAPTTVPKKKQQTDDKPKYGGTVCDLRIVKMERLGEILVDLGIPADEVSKIERWDRTWLIEQVASSELGQTILGGSIARYARVPTVVPSVQETVAPKSRRYASYGALLDSIKQANQVAPTTVPKNRQQTDDKPKYGGTANYLRFVKMERLGEILVDLGIPADEVSKIERWDRTWLIEQVASSELGQTILGGSIARYARVPTVVPSVQEPVVPKLPTPENVKPKAKSAKRVKVEPKAEGSTS